MIVIVRTFLFYYKPSIKTSFSFSTYNSKYHREFWFLGPPSITTEFYFRCSQFRKPLTHFSFLFSVFISTTFRLIPLCKWDSKITRPLEH